MSKPNRKSSNASRLRKGDRFIDPRDGALLEVTGWPQSFTEGVHQVPVIKVGGLRSRRRSFKSKQRFALI